MPVGDGARKAILAGLVKASKLRVSPKVVVTPEIQEAITAYDKLFARPGILQALPSGTVRLSTYTEGYAPRVIPGEYGSYPSVGGDHEVGYVVRESQTEEVRILVSLEVKFYPDGRVVVVLEEPGSSFHKGKYDPEENILVQGRGFGSAGVKALIRAKKTFAFWEARFV
jgi:hypothetical protein